MNSVPCRALPNDRPGLSRRDVGVARFVVNPAVLIPQFLDLKQACFGQSRLRVVGQSEPEQLSAKLGKRYAELLIGIRGPAFDRASPKRGVAQRVCKPAVVRPMVGCIAANQREDNLRVGEFDERRFEDGFRASPVHALITLQHLLLERWEFPAEVRELSRQVKGINATRIAQLSLADQREKGLGRFLGADLDDGLCGCRPSRASGLSSQSLNSRSM